jgi:hypothetical protein
MPHVNTPSAKALSSNAGRSRRVIDEATSWDYNMTMKAMDIQVFVREEAPGRSVPAYSINKNLRDQTNSMIHKLQQIMIKNDINPYVRDRSWPLPRSDKKIISQPGEMDYKHLNLEDYDTDIAICAVPSLKHVEGAVGSLLLRERGLFHLCLLSAEPIAGPDEDEELYQGLLALPIGIYKRKGETLYSPAHVSESDGSNKYIDAVKGRVMTIDSFAEFDERKMENIVHLVKFQKAA